MISGISACREAIRTCGSGRPVAARRRQTGAGGASDCPRSRRARDCRRSARLKRLRGGAVERAVEVDARGGNAERIAKLFECERHARYRSCPVRSLRKIRVISPPPSSTVTSTPTASAASPSMVTSLLPLDQSTAMPAAISATTATHGQAAGTARRSSMQALPRNAGTAITLASAPRSRRRPGSRSRARKWSIGAAKPRVAHPMGGYRWASAGSRGWILCVLLRARLDLQTRPCFDREVERADKSRTRCRRRRTGSRRWCPSSCHRACRIPAG